MRSPWNEYRVRLFAFLLSPLLALLWLVPGSRICSSLVRSGWNHGAANFLAVALPALGILAVAHLNRVLWPCPRCGRSFHVNLRIKYGNPFSSRCLNCGLPLWEGKAKVKPAPWDEIDA